MIKIEDMGEEINTEVSGAVEEILMELAFLIANLKKSGFPNELIMASVKAGLEEKDEAIKDEE